MPRRFATAALTLTAAPFNSRLKLALFNTGLPQCQIAARLGMSAVRLSRIVRGRAEPTDDEQDRLAELLGRPRRQLFRVTA